MTTQRELGQAFEAGATEGRASNLAIQECAGGYALVDVRGPAVLAYRFPGTHRIVSFDGWYGFSTTTSCMMTKAGVGPQARRDDDRIDRADVHVHKDPTPSEVDDILEGLDVSTPQ